MNFKQYNNVLDYTLKHEPTAQTGDSLATARAIFDNMGVALPQGDMKTVYETIKSDDYMGWTPCTMQEAQEAADKGTAAIGISEDQIVVLSANDEEQPVAQTASVMTLNENTPAYAVDGLQYYVYRSGTTLAIPNLIDYAKNEIGENSQKYTAWFGVSASTSWCAIFASWCAQQCDFITRGVMPKFMSCTEAAAEWFKPKGLFKTRENYVPQKGDLIFFNWSGKTWGTPWTEPTIPAAYDKDNYTASNNFQHVGIVEKVENGRVYTIEGNSGSLPNNQTVVKRNNYSLQYSYIRGYCVPRYEKY